MPIYLGADMLVDIAHVEGLTAALAGKAPTAATDSEVVVGSTVGNDSSGSYADAATNVNVNVAKTIRAISFYSPVSGTFTLQFDGVTVGSPVSVTNGGTGTFLNLSLNFSVGAHTLKLVPSLQVRVRFVGASSISYMGGDFTASGWIGVGAAYTIPFLYTVLVSAVVTRRIATYTSASLAANGQAVGVVALHPSYRLIKISTSRQCRVRLYDTIAHRTSDLARPRTTAIDANTDHGLMLDMALQAGSLTRTLSPLVDGVNFETGNDVALTVDNLDTIAGTVAVTFTYIRAE